MSLDLRRPDFPRSLHLRLLLSMVAVAIVAVSVTGLVASRRTLAEFQAYVDTANAARYHRFTAALARDYSVDHGWADVLPDVERDSQLNGQRVVVADAQGIIVADSNQSLVGMPASAAWLNSQAPILANGVEVGTLYLDPVAGPSPADVAFVWAINRSVLLGAGVACLAAVAITLLLAGSIVKPVESLTAAARRMKTGDLAVQVPVGSEDEIGELAHAFNAMASGLAQQEKLRRSMVEDIAHELRTPLTNLRGYLEAARDGLLAPDSALVENLYEETMLLQRLVTDLQDLALADAGQLALVREPTPLSALAEQAVGILRPQAEAKGVTLQVAVPPELPLVDVDPGRIGQVLRNLLYNAYLHTPTGGRIAVAAQVQGPMVAVSVADTGLGISADDLPHVFDRFYRGDKSRARHTGGAGLGLAIVRQLVIAHNGNVSVTSETGQGSVFSFTVPVAS
jgi:signal transduction histidine kinase